MNKAFSHITRFFKRIGEQWELRRQLHPLPDKVHRTESPKEFTYPFCYRPHKLCRVAADEVINYCYSTPEMVPTEGKMFGVLIVEHKGKRYYLRAFSGIYNGSYHHKGFVPPVVDLQDPKGHFRLKEQEIVALTNRIGNLYSDMPGKHADPSEFTPEQQQRKEEIAQLKALRKEMSQDLQMWTFHQFRMKNARGEEADLIDIFKDYKSPFPEEEYIAYKEGRIATKPKGKYGVPPGGAGECCAPKLLQYAYQHGLKPICMEEFWIGPSKGNQMRVERNFYPACQHKCVPILTFMLKGLNVEENPLFHRARLLLKRVRIIHEKEDFMIVYKPSGLLSVPSKNHGEPSLMDYLYSLNPNYHLMHRLDQDTSGVMIVAKTHEACGWIQKLFMEHLMMKKYVAILDEPSPMPNKALLKAKKAQNILHDEPSEYREPHSGVTELRTIDGLPQGTISLPLSKNPFDSPRQVVDHRFGKSAVTYYEFTSPRRIELYPESGRTHQLRIHCAHPEGLGRPIKGDILYGTASDRLYLHAESLGFCHPITGKWMHFEDKAF
ncbi:MAG: RluA family pseudouridine synthase [Bacteroidaceae bacterium]|nr:RluA family pseudouridine synthase [Bacteroidaceae bacterium]